MPLYPRVFSWHETECRIFKVEPTNDGSWRYVHDIAQFMGESAYDLLFRCIDTLKYLGWSWREPGTTPSR